MTRRHPTVLVAQDEAPQTSRRHGEVLLVSALDTLPLTSPELIDAMTLFVPVEGDDEATALQKLALELAEEHDMHAEIAVSHSHLIVRLTRRDYGGIQPIE